MRTICKAASVCEKRNELQKLSKLGTIMKKKKKSKRRKKNL
ncbi:hypothetical protein HMPREF9554_03097 [Treponema phagedenis F0421]|nr:hypothetical protein HMPREF9554_03097 [Treponema phagedenis F0421]